MIFVTVGTQLPFDRMVRAVDAWAGANGRSDVFAQIGPSEYRPQHIKWAPFLSADECRRKMQECTALVAHAGMGSIITALELGKPIVVMPRLAEYREHRNDHQLATAKRFLALGRVRVAFDEQHLLQKLDDIRQVVAAERISPSASPSLLNTIRAFVERTDAQVAAAPGRRVPVATKQAREPLPVPLCSELGSEFRAALAGAAAD